MLKPELHRRAIKELGDAAEYYNAQEPGLGGEFLREFWHAVDIILEDPRRWPIAEHGLRKYLLPRFHHTIRYSERLGILRIIAVPHTSRKPGYWKHRSSDEQR